MLKLIFAMTRNRLTAISRNQRGGENSASRFESQANIRVMTFRLFGLLAFGPALVLSVELYDDFTSYNSSTFSYDDQTVGHTDGCKVYYLKNHSLVNSSLSLHEGTGLKMVMSATPCKQNPKECRG